MYFDETAIAESLIDKTVWFENSHAHIAILASSYSDDVIAAKLDVLHVYSYGHEAL